MSQDTLFGDPVPDPWVDPVDDAVALLRRRGWAVTPPGWLITTLGGDGALCPCCTQLVKRYRRKIHGTMVRQMVALLQAGAADRFVNLPEVARRANILSGGDISKARFWGLMVEEDVRRPDGGRAGWWMLTPLGVDWLYGRATVPKYVYLYDDRYLGSDGPPVTVRDAIGTAFNYDDLMRGV